MPRGDSFMKSTLYGSLALVLLFVAGSSCTSVLGGFDFNGNTGGSSSSSSASGSTTSAMGGKTGVGGTGTAGASTASTGGMNTCMACAAATNCPAPGGDCAEPDCVNGCCTTKNLASDTPCSTNGGHRCDG